MTSRLGRALFWIATAFAALIAIAGLQILKGDLPDRVTLGAFLLFVAACVQGLGFASKYVLSGE